MTPAGQVTILHNFGDGSTPNDGIVPEAGLILGSDGNFYGTTLEGGSTVATGANGGLGWGTAFQYNPNTGVVTILHSFGDGSVLNDGITPSGALLEASDGNFYGTTEDGGSAGEGSLYQISSSGNVDILHSFGDGSVPNDGVYPWEGLIQATDGFLYGTTQNGGSTFGSPTYYYGLGFGTIFKSDLTGNITILHSFGDGSTPNDGGLPEAALVQASDGNFYGTTFMGGSGATAADNMIWNANTGTAFQMTPSGQVTLLHSWDIVNDPLQGSFPFASLIQANDGNFYSTTVLGNGDWNGTLFQIVMPEISSISPDTLTVGGAKFTLTVNGQGFGPGSTILWNGIPLATTLVSANQLTAPVTAARIAVAGGASVAVQGPTGVISNGELFSITPAPQVQSITASPSSVIGPATSTATVTLTEPAPPAGFVVTLKSSLPLIAGVPSPTITIPYPDTSITFNISAAQVAAKTVATIKASAKGVTQSTTLTVNPIAVSSLSVSPTTVIGGNSATGTVTVTAAPASPMTVTVSSNNLAASIVGPVIIPAGQNWTTFTIDTNPVAATTTATIKAIGGGVTKTATLKIKP